jgi:RNA polymerase sigma-70 factor, ECF subfamily
LPFVVITEGAELDSTYALYYNHWVVSQANSRQLEREKFSSEITAHLDHLYRVAFHLIRNDSEAQDCVQETCARALGAYQQFRQGTNLKAWLTRILYNFFLDAYARNKRTITAADLSEGTQAVPDYLEGVPSDNPGPEKLILQRELGVQIEAALRNIPEEFRAPIVLVDMGEFSYAEAAEILSCPVGTVRSRLSRGRRQLQRQLDGYLGKSGPER